MKYRLLFGLFLVSTAQGSTSLDTEYLNRTVSEVIQAITKEAYFPIDVKQATMKALDAFSKQVDEHSSFLGPEEFSELLTETDGEYFGVGVELGPKKDDEDFLMVLKVPKGGPADKAGIRRYDRIIAIDETPIGSQSMKEILNKLRGTTRYSPVTLTILRDAKVKKYTFKRDRQSTLNTWCAYLPEQKIAYCSLITFAHNSAFQLKNALLKALKNKPKGIIIDLRDNTGGLIQAAADCAALILPKNSLVASTKNRAGKTLDRYITSDKPIIPSSIPVIVLVNNYTASAAEILAKALSYYSKKGTQDISPYIYCVGTHTFGKGSVQEVRPIGDQCALKFTTALYYMPDNSQIHKLGVTPDITLKQKYPPSKDIKLLHKLYGSHPKKPYKKPVRLLDSDALRLKALKKDHQIVSACTMIMLLNERHSVAPKDTHAKRLEWLQERFVVPTQMKAIVL